MTLTLNQGDEMEGDAPGTEQHGQEQGPGATLEMLLPAIMTSTSQFVNKGKPRAPEVKKFFRTMNEIYAAGSPEARGHMDVIGGDTMDGFMAWTTQGMGARGNQAVQWASMAGTLPGMVGGASKPPPGVDAEDWQDFNKREDVKQDIRQGKRDKEGKFTEEYLFSQSPEGRKAEKKKKRSEGLKQFGIPQFADAINTAVGYIPGIGSTLQSLGENFAMIPGQRGYDEDKSFADKAKGFAKDQAELFGPKAAEYLGNRINPLAGRLAKAAAEAAVRKSRGGKAYNLMTAEERRNALYTDKSKKEKEAESKRLAEFAKEDADYKKGNPLAPRKRTSAKPDLAKQRGIAPGTSEEDRRKVLYEQEQDEERTGQAQQKKERPELRQGSNEQLRDLELRQTRDKQEKATASMKKADTDYSKEQAARDKAMGYGRPRRRPNTAQIAAAAAARNEEVTRVRLADEAAAKRAGYVSSAEASRLAQQGGLAQEGRQTQVGLTMGQGGCSDCGGSMPSAGFLRQVLKHYEGGSRGGGPCYTKPPPPPPPQRGRQRERDAQPRARARRSAEHQARRARAVAPAPPPPPPPRPPVVLRGMDAFYNSPADQWEVINNGQNGQMKLWRHIYNGDVYSQKPRLADDFYQLRWYDF